MTDFLTLLATAVTFAFASVGIILWICELYERIENQERKTMDHQRLYTALLNDVHNLATDLRDMKLGASDREAPAYADAEEMTRDILTRADERKKQ